MRIRVERAELRRRIAGQPLREISATFGFTIRSKSL
jgi:hypothetical protein